MRRTFDPTADPDSSNHFATLGKLLPYLWPAGRRDLKIRVVLALALLAAAKVTVVYLPFLYKGAVDALDVADKALIVIPVAFVVSYGLARLFSQAFGELRDAVFAKVGQQALRTVALRTFRHLHGLALRFHLERRTGGLSRVIERGTKGIDFLLRFTLFNILPTLLEIGLVCGVLLIRYDAWLALVTFVAVAGYVTFTVLITEWRVKYRREMNRTDSEASTRAIDSLLNFETVKYFSNEAHEANRFDEAMARYQKAAVTSQTTLSLLNIGQGVIIASGLIVVMLMAANGVVEREIADRPDAHPLETRGGEVVFDAVSFAYDPERPILRDVSFRVPPGQTVAIVGPSGAGKSTISRLLYRFYDVTGGRILIDGHDVRDLTQESLRHAIGIVPQDTVLFNDSIRYNIRYGRPGADDNEIAKAAELARIHDFIQSLPEGYGALVGERGLKLSGGEKQRVAIARTILKDPEILIFDEATSALDTETEKEIQQSLDSVSRDRTTLIIAHRLSTVVEADEIIVLDSGRIVERGRHQTLLDEGGVYARMWARQQEAQAAESRLKELVE
jgi:ATP-binding cassette subfamily B protein